MYDATSPVPVYPHVQRTAVLFALLGAVLCFGAFLVWYILDTTVRSEEDLKQICDLPILGVIPDIITENKSVSNVQRKGEGKKNV
jgi:capsular polysaccharide biosynthesis protein